MDRIRNWHREEFKEGKLENIPPQILDQLKAEGIPEEIRTKITVDIRYDEPEKFKQTKKVKLNEP